MRWLLGIFLFLGFGLLGGYIFLKGHPFKLYSNWVDGKEWNWYYNIPNYDPSFLRPSFMEEIPPYKEDYEQLWRAFPLRNALIPLPTRHPLFKTVPLVQQNQKETIPQIGMIILAPNDRELSRIYTLPKTMAQDHSMGQELFKLPFVKNRIMQMDPDTVWNDVFTRNIQPTSKNLEEMIRDLYVLHLRSKLLPDSTLKYGSLKDNKALIELTSKDQDYKVELIMNHQAGNIYSFVLRTEKNNPESIRLRSKFLESITFSPADSAMGNLLYAEFKQLNFNRQMDQEGMLYLFSAWTQEVEKMELLKEIIFFLERSGKNRQQLKVFHEYAFKKYGKTFTTRLGPDEDDEPSMALQRKLELEKQEKLQELERERMKVPETPELSPKERMNMYLKKAKEERALEKKKEMTIH